MPDTPTPQDCLPSELHDTLDAGQSIYAVRADTMTRGQAQAFFAREYGIDSTAAKVRRASYREDTEFAAEMKADGIEEPYDGWPLIECHDDAAGSAVYWVLRAECRS